MRNILQNKNFANKNVFKINKPQMNFYIYI